MSSDNLTIPEFRAMEINALALEIIRQYALNPGRETVAFALSSLSFGAVSIELAFFDSTCSRDLRRTDDPFAHGDMRPPVRSGRSLSI